MKGQPKRITENWMPDSFSHWIHQTCKCLILGFCFIQHRTCLYCLFGFLLLVPESMLIDTNVKATGNPRFPHPHSTVHRHSTWELSLSQTLKSQKLAVYSTRGCQLDCINQKSVSAFWIIHFLQNVFGKGFMLFSKRSSIGNTNNTFWFITSGNMKALKFFNYFGS